jgi:hypothetical protein
LLRSDWTVFVFARQKIGAGSQESSIASRIDETPYGGGSTLGEKRMNERKPWASEVTIRCKDLIAFWALLTLLLCLDKFFLHPPRRGRTRFTWR